MYYIQENDKPNITTKIFKKIEIDSNKILLPKIEENKKWKLLIIFRLLLCH